MVVSFVPVLSIRSPSAAMSESMYCASTSTDSVVGPEMGVAPSDVPDLTTLMVGPLLRGGQVNLK